jgi:predicted GIY-YIG superfamily endonuclease
MPQTLLFPDPRPLVERLGQEFFQQAPECPGVYLMRDAADAILYVGKAKNLRKRLASYRVANPDRLARRQLRLLRAVTRIELQECSTESAALTRESELLRNLRPRFNRAGTWPGPRRFVAWRVTEEGLDLAATLAVEPGWLFHGPMGAGAFPLRAILVRLCWCAIHPERGLAGMPEGWFHGRCPELATIPASGIARADLDEVAARLQALFAGDVEPFAACIRDRTAGQTHPFESTSRDADLEALSEFAGREAERLGEA